MSRRKVLQELVDLLFMHVRNGSHKSMHNYNKILEEISDGLEVEKVFLGKAKSIIATIYYYLLYSG